MREPELHISGDDIADVLVGILSQTGFKVMQKCNTLKPVCDKIPTNTSAMSSPDMWSSGSLMI